MSDDFVFVAQAPASQAVLAKARQLASNDLPVLIIGSDGSGRKRLADFIHWHSKRSNGPYHSLDCDLLVETTWLSRLFGHVAGAFPGAIVDRAGLLEMSAGGTLLLREIDRGPSELQARLQRALEDQVFARLGREEDPIPLGCRILATGGPSANKALQTGLHSVVAGAVIELPPLCKRPEDIPVLLNYFLAMYNAQYGKQLGPPPSGLLSSLCSLPWEGDVQELENAIKAAVQRSFDQTFSIELFPEPVRARLTSLHTPTRSDVGTDRTNVAELLIDHVEEMTLRTLEGGLLPLPASAFRCEQAALEQSLVRELVEGTLRACRKYLAQTASEVRELGTTATLRRLGLDDTGNALHAALEQALLPILEALVEPLPEGADTSLLALVEMPARPRQLLKLPSATFEDVYMNHDRVEKIIRGNAGKRPTRDRMAIALSEFLGKNVSAGLVSKVRKAMGKAKDRSFKSSRPMKTGLEMAEEAKAKQLHREQAAAKMDEVRQSDRRMDDEDYGDRVRKMFPAEREQEARVLHVDPALPLEDLICQLCKSKTILESIKEGAAGISLSELRERAEKQGIRTSDLKKADLIDAIHRAVLRQR